MIPIMSQISISSSSSLVFNTVTQAHIMVRKGGFLFYMNLED